MRFRELVKEFQPVALIAAILGCVDYLDLGVVRAVAGYWAEAAGHEAGFGLHGAACALLDDSVCFALLVLLALLGASVPPLGTALSRTLAAIRAIKINPHVAYPAALALLAGAAWCALFHDTGTVRGMFLLLMDNGVVVLKRFVVSTHKLFPPPVKPPTHTHPICPCDLNPFVQFPADAVALGVIFTKVAVQYSVTLETAWRRRKRATPPLHAIQEL